MPLQYFFYHIVVFFVVAESKGTIKNIIILQQVTEWYKTTNEKPAF